MLMSSKQECQLAQSHLLTRFSRLFFKQKNALEETMYKTVTLDL